MKQKKHSFRLKLFFILLIISICFSGIYFFYKTTDLPSLYVPPFLIKQVTITGEINLTTNPVAARYLIKPTLNHENPLGSFRFALVGHPLLTSRSPAVLTLEEFLPETRLITNNQNIIIVDSLENLSNLILINLYRAFIPLELVSPPLKIIKLVDIDYYIESRANNWWEKINDKKVLENVVISNKDESEKITTLAFVGDIMLSRRVGLSIKNKGLDYPFKNINNILTGFDLLFANLESVISSKGTKANQPITFRATPDTIEILKKSEISVVSLANNHALDFGQSALLDCLKVLAENGITSVGAGKNLEEASLLKIKEINDLKIGFLAYNLVPPVGLKATQYYPGVNPFNPDTVGSLLANHRPLVDILIVSLHWGIEYTHIPTEEQKKFADLLFANGVDLIIGHHPHVLQPVVISQKQKIVAYSLGNFLFDQDFSEETSTGGILVTTVYKKKIIAVEFIPTYIIKDQLSLIANEEQKEKINRILQFKAF